MEPRLIDLQQHIDDRGTLFEAWRHSWETFKYGDSVDLTVPQVQQVYLVHNATAGVLRAFHRHQFLWDGFCIVKGSAIFHVCPGDLEPRREDRVHDMGWEEVLYVETEDMRRYALRDNKPQLLIVPPTYWHGWLSLEPDTLLLSIASHEYNPENPDEERIHDAQVRVRHQGRGLQGDHFGYVDWNVKAK